MIFLFDVERGPDGFMKIKPPAPQAPPSLKELHARKCFLLGIDPAKWPALWDAERERIEAARAPERHPTSNRHGREG